MSPAGYLHIAARQQSVDGHSYTSARMKSQGLFSFTYGRIEWRAQLPNGADILAGAMAAGNEYQQHWMAGLRGN